MLIFKQTKETFTKDKWVLGSDSAQKSYLTQETKVHLLTVVKPG